jgi:2-polyprenyl-3-methyl-5-hydroxy-6-metoxy-1,4-benzoquinol methylase
MRATLGYRLRQAFRRSHRSDAYFSHFDRIASLPLEAVSIFAALKKAVGQPEGGILDVGCGLGYVAQGLGASLAVDPNPHAVERARQLFPQVPFEVRGAGQLADGRRFGAVVCVNVLEHLSDEEREAFFRSLPRLLTPQGRLFAVYDSLYHPMQLLSALYRPGTLVADPTHVHCWSQAAFRRELRRWVDIEREEGGNIQSLTLPWGNRFKTARLYVCRARTGSA